MEVAFLLTEPRVDYLIGYPESTISRNVTI